MHYKKHKLHKLHSIPIRFRELSKHRSLCKKLYLVSYSIPLSCMVVLLLGGIVAINPSLPLKSSAVTIEDEWVVKEKDDSSSDINNVSENDINSSTNTLSDADAGISVASVVPTPTLGITVSNSNQIIDAVQGGNTVYGSYNVSLTGSNVKDYTLSIKADSVNLVAPSQASTTTTVGGAGGKTGNSMTANTWGYKLTETSTSESSYGTLNYASLPTSLQQIANGNVSSPYNLSMDKKLVFAAKFKDDAAPGTYKGHITLSAVANQAVVGAIWSNGLEANITDMQDIGSGFCKNNTRIVEGDTIDLKDSRDQKTYTIYKAADGNCWMGQNLALTGPKTLASGDTNLASGTTWDLPASVGSGGTNKNDINTSNSWDTSNYNVIQVRTGSDLGSSWKSGYGNYYSWRAATAGTGTTSVTGTDASGSICPKGWTLPSASQLNTLIGTRSAWTTANYNGNSGVPGYYIGSTQTKVYKGANFWPAAGLVAQASGALGNAGSDGFYWSRSAYSSNSYAYRLGFYSSNIGTDNGLRWYGFSVRCVATY